MLGPLAFSSTPIRPTEYLQMKKRILLTMLVLIALAGILAGIKALQIGRMIDAGAQFVPPPETVTTTEVRLESWESLLTAVGSLTAVQGVTVAAEMPGKVTQIAFEPGSMVKKGELLLKQDTSSEQAQLPGAEASVTLAKANLERARELLAQKIISQAEFDSAEASFKVAVAAAESIRATIGKKTLRAPFAGRLGIRLVNLGQILQEGDPVVSLQTLDPIYVDFLLPQQQLAEIRTGLPVRVTTDALPGQRVEGFITTINPEVDAATRNIRLQAKVSNPEGQLRPGMYVTVAVVLPRREQVLAIPAPAVLYAPYSDSVFVVEEKKAEAGGQPEKLLRQQFVRLGEKQGDFVAAISGLKEGETIVTTGVFKLRNSQVVMVDNTLSPEFEHAPKPENN
jgi:membrane fusion protein (multidrug efflux system)